ncbi:MAG: hypothetical protein C4297_08950 [Gemmataceae bacterium]
MVTAYSEKKKLFDTLIAPVMEQAVVQMLGQILGEPVVLVDQGPVDNGHCPHEGEDLLAIIAFTGDIKWAYSLVLPKETATDMARRFAGFDIPYESQDMGDVVGEIANVLAGNVVALLDRQRIRCQLSVPTVARGRGIKIFGILDASQHRLHFEYSGGKFWFRLTAAPH